MFAGDEDAARRLTLGTYRPVDRGTHHEAVPDFTRARAADLDFLETPAEIPDAADFSPFLRPGTAAWDDYFSTRKVVRRVRDDGTPVVSVTSNVADALSKTVATKAKPGVKRFEVAHLLTDVDLMDKFSIRGRFRADLKNMAVVDTQRAADLLQQHIRTYEGYERAEVRPGAYAYSWKAARERLKLQAARFPEISVAISATFIGDKIFIYGDQEKGEAGWRVFGPMRSAWLVMLVHRMVAHTNCEVVAFAMGPELTILDIDIHDGETVLSPCRERHAGPHDDLPLRSSTALAAALSLSSLRALQAACEAVETVAVEGEDVASAVRITSKYVLVNSHVADEKAVTAGGKPLFPQRMLTKDLWLARCDGPDVVWHLRQPEEGEQVVLCYRRHQELQFSDPVRVLQVSDEILTLEKNEWMQHGVSGAAVVALRDLALVGLYDGLTLRRALVAAFTPAMYTEVCTLSEIGSDSHVSSAGQAQGVYSALKSRGLGKVVDAAMASVVPLYSGNVHVGMGFSHGGRICTVCDPDVAPLSVAPEGRPLTFEKLHGPFFAADLPGFSTPPPAVVRKPSYGEGVFVIGKDADGDYYSVSKARVTHVGVDAAFFQISPLKLEGALPLLGGLVVAHADAAVIGCFAGIRSSAARGEVGQCYTLPEVKRPAAAVERPEAALLRIFPFIRPGAWPPGVAEAAVTHASAADASLPTTMAALAMVGDSAMRTALWVRLQEAGVPTARWQSILQEDQCNAGQVAACERLGLSKVLRVGRGVNVPAGSKVFADMLEAVAGAVYLNESIDVFETFCKVIGALRVDYCDSSGPGT